MNRRRTLSLGGCVLLAGAVAQAARFYPDDPLWQDPPPFQVGKIEKVDILAIVDFYKNTVYEKGERHTPGHVIPSQGVNTLGEVPDSAWYTNRHGRSRMQVKDLVRGPAVAGPPTGDKWTVTSAKAEGVTPGFSIKDAKGRRYLLKFDPSTNLELSTAADVIGSKFFYALGYNVPENYTVRFRREQLVIQKGLKFRPKRGHERELTESDLNDLLRVVAHYPDGSIRALASLYLSGEPVGPFKFYKRRPDDPNEISPHEHMRVLRGLQVFAAWLNHTDAKSLNTLDMVVEENGRRIVRHHLIDFGASLGSDSLWVKDPRLGHDYFLDPRPGLIQLTTLGLAVPKYARIDYPDNPAVGNFSSEDFYPDKWKPNYPNAAFENRLPGDEFWAAKQVMRFTDEEIRDMVRTGNYTDTEAPSIIAAILSRRRDIIGKTFFEKVLPVDNVRIENGRLAFDDLRTVCNFGSSGVYQVGWAAFDNARNQQTPLAGATGVGLPGQLRSAASGTYWAATLKSSTHPKSATVFVRRDGTGWTVVGIEREGENEWRPR